MINILPYKFRLFFLRKMWLRRKVYWLYRQLCRLAAFLRMFKKAEDPSSLFILLPLSDWVIDLRKPWWHWTLWNCAYNGHTSTCLVGDTDGHLGYWDCYCIDYQRDWIHLRGLIVKLVGLEDCPF